MTPERHLAYTTAHSEIRAGNNAKKIGNLGKARVHARRSCGIAIEHWLRYNSHKNWGSSAISMLTQLQKDLTIPKEIRDAAERLTKKVDQNFETGIEENPLQDGEIIVDYFLDNKNLME